MLVFGRADQIAMARLHKDAESISNMIVVISGKIFSEYTVIHENNAPDKAKINPKILEAVPAIFLQLTIAIVVALGFVMPLPIPTKIIDIKNICIFNSFKNNIRNALSANEIQAILLPKSIILYGFTI
jgi:hypothetical protein